MKRDPIPVDRVADPRQFDPVSVKDAVFRYIFGIAGRGARGQRENPVSRKQIYAWLRQTPEDAIDDAMLALSLEGKIRGTPRGWHRPGRNNSRLQYVYQVREGYSPFDDAQAPPEADRCHGEAARP